MHTVYYIQLAIQLCAWIYLYRKLIAIAIQLLASIHISYGVLIKYSQLYTYNSYSYIASHISCMHECYQCLAILANLHLNWKPVAIQLYSYIAIARQLGRQVQLAKYILYTIAIYIANDQLANVQSYSIKYIGSQLGLEQYESQLVKIEKTERTIIIKKELIPQTCNAEELCTHSIINKCQCTTITLAYKHLLQLAMQYLYSLVAFIYSPL